jgi:two-component system heavy metal sensor histidine kinase CusS
MSRILPSAVFPLPRAQEENAALRERFEFRKAADHRPYLLISAQTANLNHEPRVIQMALDISREDALLADYRHKLGLALLFGLLSSAAIGARVAHRGLRPLEEITRTVQRITARQLHERIESRRWPSELMSLAEAFDQMLARLEDSFTRLSQFSADLAHELRTPLNNLMGEAEVALSHPRSEAEYREVLESSLEECGRLSRMVDSLLFLARADNDQVPLEFSRLEVRKELEAIREFYEAAAEEQDVAVQCEGDAMLEADPILFRRAVTNLLANALRHTPAGGRIRLAVAHSDGTGGVEVGISDTGRGIGPEHLPKVFDRFYRADPARSSDSHSTGLGLAIVQSILAMHGGTVSIHSQPGQGTTVILHFPAHPSRDPSHKRQRAIEDNQR